MKHIIFMLCLLFAINLQAQTAQPKNASNTTVTKTNKAPEPNATVDANGNFKAIERTKPSTGYTATGRTYEDSKGNVWPVYVSKSGTYYALRTSGKTGKQYYQKITVAPK